MKSVSDPSSCAGEGRSIGGRHLGEIDRPDAFGMIAELPTSIRVGSFDWNLRVVPPAYHVKTGCVGGTLHGLKEIVIVESHLKDNPQDAANTLLHEILHACWYAHAIEDGDKEERIVFTLANALQQVMRDNPSLFDLIERWSGAR